MLWMLFGVKNQPFVSATFHRSCYGFGREANAAAIGRHKTTYPDVEQNNKTKFSMDIVSFLYYLAAKVYGYVCLIGSRKFLCSMIIWEQDNGFVFSYFLGMTFR